VKELMGGFPPKTNLPIYDYGLDGLFVFENPWNVVSLSLSFIQLVRFFFRWFWLFSIEIEVDY
jgi:hypothetical protein